MFMSAKLDRLAVGSILKQEKVFLNQCLTGANANSYRSHRPLHILLREFAENSRQRTDDGWALIMRAIKCDKGIWWMPWR